MSRLGRLAVSNLSDAMYQSAVDPVSFARNNVSPEHSAATMANAAVKTYARSLFAPQINETLPLDTHLSLADKLVNLRNGLLSFGDKLHSGADNLVSHLPAIADSFSSGSGVGSGVGSGSDLGSGSLAEALRQFETIDGAPITSAVSGIQDAENRLNAWAEMMSNSAHQREVADLQAAGLNPVLSAKFGGASAPSASYVEPVSAASIEQASSGSGRSKNTGFLGLSPVSNPRTPLQMAYNVVVANGDQIVHGAKQLITQISRASKALDRA